MHLTGAIARTPTEAVRSEEDLRAVEVAPRLGPAGPAVDAGEAYRRLGPSVHGYLRGQRVADADDLLGEVFYRVTRSLTRFSGDEDDLRRWVFTIARNCVIDDRRRHARRAKHQRVEDRQDEVVEVSDRDDELISALAQLTPEQRQVIGLRFIADLAIEDVATITGRTVGAVKSMQHRALHQLENHMRSGGPQGENNG